MIPLAKFSGLRNGRPPGPSSKWNPSTKFADITLSTNDRQATAGAGYGWVRGVTSKTYGGADKAYWETTIVALSGDDAVFGICAYNTFTPASWAGGWSDGGTYLAYRPYYGEVKYNASTTDTFATAGVSDVVMMALDTAANKFWVGKNGTWFNSGNPAAGTGNCGTMPSDSVFRQIGGMAGSGTSFRFNAEPLVYSIPSGFTHWITP